MWLSGLVLMLSIAHGEAQTPNPPDLQLDPGAESNDGHVRLDWTATRPGAVYVVQGSMDKDFADPNVIYSGPDLATFLSGLKDGVYYYRVRSSQSTWSEPVRLHVQHQSLSLALALFCTGAVVFSLTVWVVIHGNYKAQV